MFRWINCAALLLFASCAWAANVEPDKSRQPRIIITTDLECDDMNGVIMSLLFSTDFDLDGIVFTAGMYHWSGDGGKHTLEEVTPHFRGDGTNVEHTVSRFGQLRSFRPSDPTWLNWIARCYAHDYPMLVKNNPNYPTPEKVTSMMKMGNHEFEGDYREETEGSKWIEQCILDDDPRPLIIQHWGGINTTVRALYSIYEKYHGTEQWEQILKKVVDKVRLGGSGEDNCRADSGIDKMFPGLQNGGYEFGFASLGSFFFSSDDPQRRAPEELQPYLHAPYTTDTYKFGHGQLLNQIWLFAEGRALYGEPLVYNYSLTDYMDWAKQGYDGWAPADMDVDYHRVEQKPYDWIAIQFGTQGFIDIGLHYFKRFKLDIKNTKIMWDEIAARADWAVNEPKDCNHAPQILVGTMDLKTKAGKTVSLEASVTDPDGDELKHQWWISEDVCQYAGKNLTEQCLGETSGWTTTFKVPKDAKKGDKFIVNLEVQDVAERPMTRFAQYCITVE